MYVHVPEHVHTHLLSLGLLDYHLLRRSEGKAEDLSDVQIEWTEAEVF